MLKGSNELFFNQATMKMIMQEWLNKNSNFQVEVTGIHFNSSLNLFKIDVSGGDAQKETTVYPSGGIKD